MRFSFIYNKFNELEALAKLEMQYYGKETKCQFSCEYDQYNTLLHKLHVRGQEHGVMGNVHFYFV